MDNNQKTAIQEMDETIKQRNDERLVEAVKIVNKAIMAEYARLDKIARTDEGDPIGIEGTTLTGHPCEVLVDPKDVAKIFLEYDYHIWKILGEEAPDTMWDDLAQKFGLATVSSVDI